MDATAVAHKVLALERYNLELERSRQQIRRAYADGKKAKQIADELEQGLREMGFTRSQIEAAGIGYESVRKIVRPRS